MFTINQPVNFYDETDQFISQLSPTTNSNQQIIQEQFRQSEECLATSAAYMKEIDSFFRELSTAPRTIDTPSATSTLSFETFDLSEFTTHVTADDGGAIDPAVIFNIDHMTEAIYNDESVYNDHNDEDEIYEDSLYHDPSDQFGIICFQRKPQRLSSSRLRKPTKSHNNNKKSHHLSNNSSSNDSLSASSFGSPKSGKSSSVKAPKFYSRSGQVADPNRGPCHNCHTTLTCYWRKLDGLYYCNACTLFYKRNNEHRDVKEIVVDKPIKRRNRKSKYSEL